MTATLAACPSPSVPLPQNPEDEVLVAMLNAEKDRDFVDGMMVIHVVTPGQLVWIDDALQSPDARRRINAIRALDLGDGPEFDDRLRAVGKSTATPDEWAEVWTALEAADDRAALAGRPEVVDLALASSRAATVTAALEALNVAHRSDAVERHIAALAHEDAKVRDAAVAGLTTGEPAEWVEDTLAKAIVTEKNAKVLEREARFLVKSRRPATLEALKTRYLTAKEKGITIFDDAYATQDDELIDQILVEGAKLGGDHIVGAARNLTAGTPSPTALRWCADGMTQAQPPVEAACRPWLEHLAKKPLPGAEAPLWATTAATQP